MPGNESLVTAIVDRLRPYVESAEAPGGLELIESQLRLLDALGGDAVGSSLSEMLGAVDRAIVGIESGNADAAIAEGDRWGVGHLVRAALEKGRPPGPELAAGENPVMTWSPGSGKTASVMNNPRAGAVDASRAGISAAPTSPSFPSMTPPPLAQPFGSQPPVQPSSDLGSNPPVEDRNDSPPPHPPAPDPSES